MNRIVLPLALLLVCAVPALAQEKADDKGSQAGEPYWDPTAGHQLNADVPEDEGTNNVCPGQPFNCGDVLRPAAITAGDNDYFTFTATAGDVITLGTDADGTPTVDTFVHLYNADCSTELGADDDAGPGLFSLLVVCAPYTGTYVARVRGFAATSAGVYKAFVACSPSGGFADNCGAAANLACGSVNLAGNTGCSLNDYSLPSGAASCTGFTSAGRDQVLALTVGAGGSVNLTYTSSADGSIYILSSCSPLVCVAGADATLAGQPEVLTYTFTTAGTYYLIIDSFGTNTAGNWTLTGTFDCGSTPARAGTWGELKTTYR